MLLSFVFCLSFFASTFTATVRLSAHTIAVVVWAHCIRTEYIE